MLLAIWRAYKDTLTESEICNEQPRYKVDLAICIQTNNADDAMSLVNQRLRAYRIRELFDAVYIYPIEIAADEDCYFQSISQLSEAQLPRLGLKSGPNKLFFESLRRTQQYDFVFLNECDCFPTRGDWLDYLLDAQKENQKSILIGSKYKGAVDLGDDIKTHLNGNAIYNTSHPLFNEGLLAEWEDVLAEMCRRLPDTAYDILFSRLQNIPDVQFLLNSRSVLMTAIKLTSEVDIIHNASLPGDEAIELSQAISQGAVVVHGKHFRIQTLLRSVFSSAQFLADITCQAQLFLDGPTEIREILVNSMSADYNSPTTTAKIHEVFSTSSILASQHDPKSISFFLKTYESELDIASFAIASIVKFCKNDFEIVVFADRAEELSVLRSNLSVRSVDYEDANIIFMATESAGIAPRDGYLDQQLLKLIAYRFCRYEAIFHIDSDMVFWRPFDLDDFCCNSKILLPYGHWPRDAFLPNEVVRTIQKKLALDTPLHDIAMISYFLATAGQNVLIDLNISTLSVGKEMTSVTFQDGSTFRWTASYPDICWICSSRIWGAYPYDTLRSHYMVTKSSLQTCISDLEDMTGMQIEDIVYNRELLPVLSEFQIIGNWILKSVFNGTLDSYIPLPWSELFSSHGEKIPVVKYNLKNHPMSVYEGLLSGQYVAESSRAKLLTFLGEGWC